MGALTRVVIFTMSIPVPHFSKVQRKDHARILKSQLSPEVLARLKAQEEGRAAADARAEEGRKEVAAKMAADYERNRADIIKAERAKRLLDNADKYS